MVLKGDPKKLSLHGVRMWFPCTFTLISVSRHTVFIVWNKTKTKTTCWFHQMTVLSLSHSVPSVTHTADVRCVSGGLQSERRAGSVAMPTCFPQEVSTGEHSGVFLCSCYHFVWSEVRRSGSTEKFCGTARLRWHSFIRFFLLLSSQGKGRVVRGIMYPSMHWVDGRQD